MSAPRRSINVSARELAAATDRAIAVTSTNDKASDLPCFFSDDAINPFRMRAAALALCATPRTVAGVAAVLVPRSPSLTLEGSRGKLKTPTRGRHS
jgi:hypothetical protein